MDSSALICEGKPLVFQDSRVEEKELSQLMTELDEISSDFSQYLNFLLQRRSLMEQVLSEGGVSNN